jgi:elongation factor G
MFGYINTLRSKTQGRAGYTMAFSKYEVVPEGLIDKIKEKRGMIT